MVSISKNFDLKGYKEKISNIQSGYIKYNLPSGVTEAQAIKQKKIL